MPLAAKLTTSAAEGLPRRRFTVAEVEAMVAAGVMQEDERVELIGGELVPMSPKGNQHEVLKAALLRRWYRAAPDEVDLVPETTFRLS
jgi:Uma2 family endonuclease